ncbi:adenylylsulfate kinase [Desulfobotulus alkaliphilus]|uniref:Adenylylsulfate kinase n=1 Tax=Desulfobotulus alkaliphilus TaxID=622671 RepID=A0A562RTY4_9BACT|nr:adenylyl-sulfate kinase [Desulfobotulus alkaliphilus]TWI72363.1 adenylylsulfate kinase [Desulfobotulus alkaliphilus]
MPNNIKTDETKKGRVLWITGLSGAGKTTLSRLLFLRLRQLELAPILLDGDELRAVFGQQAYNMQSRLELGYSYINLCKTLSSQGHIVIIAVIGLIKDLHLYRKQQLPDCFDIFLDVPISELQLRDPKGLYLKYRQGLVKDVYGLDLKADPPPSPHLHLRFDPCKNAEDWAAQVEDALSTYLVNGQA